MSKAVKIWQYFEDHHQEMIDFLKSLVSIETPSRNPETQDAIFDFLSEKLRSLEYFTLRVPGKKTGGFLMARHDQRIRRQPLQLLVGHCDTVWNTGTLKEMPITEMDGILKGPGVYDMKAGLTQILFSLQAIQELGFPLAVSPVILINSDEEIGSRESTHAIRRLAKIADRAFVLEPPLGLEGKLKTARKGLGRFTVRVQGKPAHAGLDPDAGVSAIEELSHQIQRLFALNDPGKGITVNVGMIEGGISPNVIAPESKAVIDVRVLTHEDGEAIKKAIYALKPVNLETTLHIDGSIGRPPMEKTDRNVTLWQIAQKAATQMGLDLHEGTAGGGSDGNTTSLFTATLDGLGTTGDGAHAHEEHILTDKLIERSTLLTMLLLEDPLVQAPSN